MQKRNRKSFVYKGLEHFIGKIKSRNQAETGGFVVEKPQIELFQKKCWCF